jgi:hypothetical protein
VGSRDSVDVEENRKVSCFFRDSNPGSSNGGLRMSETLYWVCNFRQIENPAAERLIYKSIRNITNFIPVSDGFVILSVAIGHVEIQISF